MREQKWDGLDGMSYTEYWFSNEVAANTIIKAEADQRGLERARWFRTETRSVRETIRVCQLRCLGTEVRFNVETRIDPRKPDATPGAEASPEALVREIRLASMEKRAMIQSFDWRTLNVARRIPPETETVCLTTEHGDEDNLGLGRADGLITDRPDILGGVLLQRAASIRGGKRAS